MKKILNLKTTLPVALLIFLMVSCNLDEVNYSTADTEIAYTSPEGFESLINYGYDALYYYYGKIDGIGAQEMGTDLWWSESKYTAYTQYNGDLNTEQGQNNVFWQGFYATINYANSAIYFADKVEGYTDAQRNAKVAEAHFLRGWSYLQLVEQYGGVTLTTKPSILATADVDNFPVRSSEEAIYELILSDLEFASQHLPISQGPDRGRISKKGALGMLAKAYLQRTRLGDEALYAGKALATAKDLIDNSSAYGCELYTSTATKSGYAQLWDGVNNKANKEFLFIEAVDAETFFNPDGGNRGRTRQYYEMDLKSVGAEWGTTEKNCAWYGRANDRGFKPTKYLLTEIFSPVANPADTRFENTFFSEYYNSTWSDFTIKQPLVTKYGKDQSLVNRVIKNTAGTYVKGSTYYAGRTNYYGVNASGNVNMVDNNSDGYLDGISVFTPNYPMTALQKSTLPFLVVTPDEQFDANGKWVTAASGGLGAEYSNCYPSFNKLSSIHWIYNNQRWMGDVPILRLGDVYLIAAEAALRKNNDQATAAGYVNTLRKRAAITSRENEMTVSAGQVTLDFILAERARELTGEQVRWEDLKRFGKLTNAYLNITNPDITAFVDGKHTVRPIPQPFLDAIGNADEYGTNGY
ncbi:RagB/SusD family nutrient uptake outer membrane protein [Mariniflexile litorale]|uniref:RagB/SusD family nutrient uptake outer membrane protein n=1 Tax=Mariniflexile litorale TaxID=3045158 RepID=A0AAU7EJP9_9FLAO|nr:RagB/SusD family nutrient uptake outer membrane protein [Mariniflexile sp. KMM 9835]MDQ8211137.1 RagB/SusD family nutrient uptake outer membrane protein [Mariniflexile sp. KMM 9835]